MNVVQSERPDLIISAGAYTASTRRKRSRRRPSAANSVGPRNLACVRAIVGARVCCTFRLILCLTARARGLVFRLTPPPIRKASTAAPKRGGEESVLQVLPTLRRSANGVGVRRGWKQLRSHHCCRLMGSKDTFE